MLQFKSPSLLSPTEYSVHILFRRSCRLKPIGINKHLYNPSLREMPALSVRDTYFLRPRLIRSIGYILPSAHTMTAQSPTAVRSHHSTHTAFIPCSLLTLKTKHIGHSIYLHNDSFNRIFPKSLHKIRMFKMPFPMRAPHSKTKKSERETCRSNYY